ncbi:MAG: hypothetical protein HZC45_03515 [Deltaproteobacteria bacterium]|nr:hypothetical protein [Deltaproteobacteria bacterium]
MHIAYLILTLVILFLIVMLLGKVVKRLPANIVKTVNWTSFFFAAVSGLLLYLKATIIPYNILIPIFALSLIVYFIFYDYNYKGVKE